MSPKILTLDIETAPNLAYVWGMFKQNVGLSQLVETGEVISFAAKWHGKKKVLFYSVYHDGKEAMIQAAHDLISEADIVVHYNGKSFDMPWLNREFLLAGLEPPAPYRQVDLLLVVRKQFNFTSNKLDHVAQKLDLGAKTSHTGFQLWLDCMAGKASAWKLMKQYNKHDVALTEKLYDKLLPWINPHPNMGLYNGEVHCCPKCGSKDLQKRGYAYTNASVFQRYACNGCGGWSRGSRRVDTTGQRDIAG